MKISDGVNPFTPKSDHTFKFPLQPQQKNYITYEELGFSSLTQMKDDYTTNSTHLTYTFLLKRLGECSFSTSNLFCFTQFRPRVCRTTTEGSMQPAACIVKCLYL